MWTANRSLAPVLDNGLVRTLSQDSALGPKASPLRIAAIRHPALRPKVRLQSTNTTTARRRDLTYQPQSHLPILSLLKWSSIGWKSKWFPHPQRQLRNLQETLAANREQDGRRGRFHRLDR
ncbi:MAG TPA: hypothetical protein VIS96_03360 [Terrimicrobiaceae bacterium]